jgi:hypothetical protein
MKEKQDQQLGVMASAIFSVQMSYFSILLRLQTTRNNQGKFQLRI